MSPSCEPRSLSLAYVAEARALRGEEIRVLTRRAVRARLADGLPQPPHAAPSKSGSIYTALETVITAERLSWHPSRRPRTVRNPTGWPEGFVHTLRRDYFAGADLSSVVAVIRQLYAWQADYRGITPHSALGYRAPREYRAARADEVE